MTKTFKIFLSGYYLFYILYVIVFFFIDNPFDNFEWLLLSIHLILLITCIYFILKNEKLDNFGKVFWIILSLIFPFSLIYYVWRIQ